MILFSSCKVSENARKELYQPLPSSYNNKTDSINAADINWKTFFKDAELLQLIDNAVEGNQDLQMAYQRINIAKANVRFARGQSLPFVGIGTSAGQTKYGKYTQEGVGNYDVQFSPNITRDMIVPEHLPYYSAGLVTSWEADVWGKLRNRRKAASARYLSSIEGKNWLLSNLIAEIASSYYMLLALDQELEIIRETITLQSNELSIIQLQKEAGRANELAVKQFQAQLYNTQGLEVNIMQRIVETENYINFLAGRYPQEIKRNKNNFNKNLPAEIKSGIPSDLLTKRPDVRQAELELIAMKANVKAARAAFYPSLNITGFLGYQSFNPDFLISPQSFAYNILAGLAAPLLNTSAIRSQFKSATAGQSEALYNYQKIVINAYMEVYNQMSNINNLNRIHELKNSEVGVLTNSIETASELFLTGRATYLEVIITRTNALKSRLELIEIKRKQYDAAINIYKALGGGWQ
ncbi:MAG: TolC family protein [Cytophagaceae bacterium]